MGTGEFFGDVTLPGAATHACVFMLAGLTTRRKQIVAYDYIGNYTHGTVYLMSPLTWEASTGQSGTLLGWTTWVPHPVQSHPKLHFMPDVLCI